MTDATRIKLWRRALFIGAALLLAAATLAQGDIASAHGKQLSVEVSSVAPDPEEPLVRLYRAYVVYAADRDPISGATVTLTAARQGGGPPIDPVVLRPLDEPGVYVAQVQYPLFGAWDVALVVADLGEGSAAFVEDLTPAGPTGNGGEARKQALDLFFRFDWKDVAAIAVRVSHTLGGVLLFALTGVVISAYAFLSPGARPPLFRRLSRIYTPLTVLALALLAASGAYTAAFSAPVRPPGVFAMDVMLQIPFGGAYLVAIALKAVALVAFAVIAIRMRSALRWASIASIPAGSSVDAPAILRATRSNTAVIVALRGPSPLRLAVINVAVGVFLAVDIVVAIYLHYISHLAIFVPS